MGRNRGKLRSADSVVEFDETPFMINQAAAHVQETLALVQNSPFIGKNLCPAFLAVAHDGLETNDPLVQHGSLALVGKIATATDDLEIRTQAMDLLCSQFNSCNHDVAAAARQTYQVAQSNPHVLLPKTEETLQIAALKLPAQQFS